MGVGAHQRVAGDLPQIARELQTDAGWFLGDFNTTPRLMEQYQKLSAGDQDVVRRVVEALAAKLPA